MHASAAGIRVHEKKKGSVNIIWSKGWWTCQAAGVGERWLWNRLLLSNHCTDITVLNQYQTEDQTARITQRLPLLQIKPFLQLLTKAPILYVLTVCGFN